MRLVKNAATFLMVLLMAIALCACGSSDDSSTNDDGGTDEPSETEETTTDDSSSDDEIGNLTEGNWVYTVSSDGEAILLWGDGSEKSENVVMIPAELGGYAVTTLGDGAQNVLSNNKTEDNFVLIPTSVATVDDGTVYDYNDTAGWVLPGNITTIADNAFLSCQGGIYYIEEGSAAEDYVEETEKTSSYLSEGNYNVFTVSAGENGYIQPNGTYYLPTAMLNGAYAKIISIVADIGYKIASVTIDGSPYDFLNGEAKQNEIDFTYTFTPSASGILVAFEEDPDDTRIDEDDIIYEAPDVLEDAVADGAELPGDVDDYQAVNTGSTAKYNNTVGISTGIYYAADNKLYSMVYSSQTADEPEYYSKAEVINGVYQSAGLVYGEDYDLIRLYNYYEEVTSGPSTGEVALYCAYLYKEVGEDEVDLDDFGIVEVDNSYTNTAALFAQEGADITISNLTADVYTSSRGPSEAGNFFGLGSAIHIDGGDVTTPASNILYSDTSFVKLINPQVLGTVNSIYSLASGVLEISGGNIFSCSSGGHGPYVSTGGQIYLNTESTNLINADFTINNDSSTLSATTRPASDIASMGRNEDEDMKGIFGAHDGDVTAIVTGDEAGTALATDTGGGMIVANQVTTKTYGLRCAGVYSIGYNESWVYTYNSSLVSALDAGLCSASGGYIYAYNSDIRGVMGIKTRSGGNTSSDETGVFAENSRIAAYYDSEEMIEVYDVAHPDDWDDSMAETGTSSNQLNIFLDKANDPNFYEDSLDWWFMDKSLTPGYSGGNKFAVIYVENSSTPIYVNSTKLINQNYSEYGTLSADAIAEGQTPADNLLISVESGGTGNLYFTNENSSTLWDLTGTSSETCELEGDFYLGESSESSDDPNAGSGSNTLNATFTDSQWEGTILRGDDTGVVNLVFDSSSVWSVTADAIVYDLTLEATGCLVSDAAVTITVAGSLTIEGVAITADTTIGNVTYVLDPTAITIVEDSGSGTGDGSDPGDSDPPDMGDGEEPPDSGDGEEPPDSGDGEDSGGTTVEKSGAYEQDGGTVTQDGLTYAGTGEDESAVYVYGSGTYTLTNGTLTKTGDTSGEEDSNFYGNNAIVLAEDESTITLTGCTLTADSSGSNGAFAYGEGSLIVLDNCDIATTGNSSRGVDATYGGEVQISNSTISTEGDHCAALATDRYEDNDPPAIEANNVTGTTAGEGSPGIYCTGTFIVDKCDLTATGSEAAAIEGLNSITLTDSDITGSVKWGVIIYQSMSGDSSVGTGTFDMTGGTLTNDSTGPVFMVCNTDAVINLDDVDITTSGTVLIRATDSSSGDDNINSSWGSAGGDVTFTATDQTLVGTVSCNELSAIDMTLSGTATLSGAVVIESGGEVNLTLDGGSWTATGDSYVTSLEGVILSSGTPTNVDAATGITIYYGSGTGLSASYTLSSGGTLVAN